MTFPPEGAPAGEPAPVPQTPAEGWGVPSSAGWAVPGADVAAPAGQGVAPAGTVFAGVLPAAGGPAPGAVVAPARRSRFRAVLGLLAASFAVAGLLSLIIGVVMASPADATPAVWAGAAVLALVANVCTAAAVLLGILAVILRRGRALGAAAIVVGVLANPWLQVTVFGMLG